MIATSWIKVVSIKKTVWTMAGVLTHSTPRNEHGMGHNREPCGNNANRSNVVSLWPRVRVYESLNMKKN